MEMERIKEEVGIVNKVVDDLFCSEPTCRHKETCLRFTSVRPNHSYKIVVFLYDDCPYYLKGY